MSYSNADQRKGVLMASVDYTNENRQRLMAFFRSGSKAPEDIGRLGVEVEHLIVGDDGDAISYEPTDAHKGVRDVLAYLTTWYPQQSFNDHGDLLGLLGDEGSVTLEPAAQLELSAAPYDSIAQIASHGLAGSVYGKELSTWEGMLFDLARAALPTSEKDYLVPLESFAADKPWWHVD